MDWSIRPATADDGTAIVAVQTAAWQTAYEGLLPADRLRALSEPERQERAAEMWGRRGGVHTSEFGLLVAEVDGVVSGFAATSPAADDATADQRVCELNVFHVHPAQWGTGLATALMTETKRWMRDGEYDRALLWTLRDAGRARRFYEREGWTHDGHTQTVLAKPLWSDLEIPQVRYVTVITVPTPGESGE
jgi:GNAT superfamily N-acetyltransferase